MSIGSAIVGRWNAVGFNTSICKIRLGDPNNPNARKNSQSPTTGSAPEGELLPRAEYIALDPMEELSTVGCIVYEQPFFLYVRRHLAESDQLVASIKRVRLAFYNSNKAATDPFNMGTAADDEKAISVRFVGSQYYPQHANVIEGEIAFSVRFTIRNSVPA